jgi:hypothetical protein
LNSERYATPSDVCETEGIVAVAKSRVLGSRLFRIPASADARVVASLAS